VPAVWQPTLKMRLLGGDRLLGCLLRMPADETVEMLGEAGFDFVVIDAEHGPADLIGLRTHLALAQLHSMPALVRVGSVEPALVLRTLDAGAEGVIAPHLDTAAQARALVASARYPPTGLRGFATYGRAGGFGRVEPREHLRTAQENTVVFGMIESPLGVANAAEILSVPGLDGTMVGIADLRASSTPADPDPAEAIRQVHEVAARLGRFRMDIVNSTEQARASFSDGAQLVVYNLTATFMHHLAALREAL
jgi:4-hydroxy-2-oxoheptanedioate aldolase